LLSAHQMSLVEKIAGKIFLINQGKEIYNGSLSGIFDAFGKNHLIDLEFRSPVNPAIFLNLPGVEQVSTIDDHRIGLTISAGTDLNIALAELATIEGISNITSHKPGLHEIFLKLVKTHQ